MDEGTGTTTKDDAASNTGTITGATWKTDTDCKRGSCLYFDGTDYVTTPSFALTGTVLTVTGWVKMDEKNTWQTILANGQSLSLGFIWCSRDDNNALYWEYFNGTSIVDISMPSFFTGYNNVWVHFAIVSDYSGASTEIYRNGSLIQTTAMTGTPSFPSTNNIKRIGSYGVSEYRIIDGNLDDTRIYNRKLSVAEIKAIYEGTK
jgi:hypothetical protein